MNVKRLGEDGVHAAQYRDGLLGRYVPVIANSGRTRISGFNRSTPTPSSFPSTETVLPVFNKAFAFSILPLRSPSFGANWRVAILILWGGEVEKFLKLRSDTRCVIGIFLVNRDRDVFEVNGSVDVVEVWSSRLLVRTRTQRGRIFARMMTGGSKSFNYITIYPR